MRISIILIISVFSFNFLKATSIPYDKLIYEGDTTYITYSWWPTIVESYFFQKGIENKLPNVYQRPSIPVATSLYSIEDDKLYLLKIVIGDSLYSPSKFEILSKNQTEEEKVFVNWFTGIIRCYDDCYFKVNQGTIEEYQCLNNEDRRLKSEGIKYFVENSPSKQKSRLIQEYYNYISYNYNLRSDSLLYNDTICNLFAKERIHNPIFGFNGLGYKGWPYNWENLNKSGAPLCKWIIEGDSLYLKDLYLKRNFMFESYIESLPLDSLFGDSLRDEKVFANWVNDVYSFYIVANIQEKKLFKEKIDLETHYFIKIENGVLIQVAYLKTYIFNNDSRSFYEEEDLDIDYKKLREEYNSL